MKLASLVTMLLASTVSPAVAKDRHVSPLKLERVVMLMRHGIRPPTKAQPVDKKYGAEAWPKWPVAPGLLTYRGADGVKLLGAADRKLYANLLGQAGCPAPGAVVLFASGKPRAIDTAKNWAKGFMPGCTTDVTHPTEDGPDPIFHGLDDEPASFDGQRAFREAHAMMPAGGMPAESRAYARELKTLAKVMGCATPACPLLTEPSTLTAVAHDRPSLEGPLDVGSTASQSFLLEYLEGMPMTDVGWGRVTRPEIQDMLRFHPLKFKYSNRPDYVASAAAAPLVTAMTKALDSNAALTLFAGHDTNIADIGGFLKVHWTVPSYPMDDVPPGGAIGFELWRGAGPQQFVRIFFRAQTMDQLREQRPLTGAEKPQRAYLPIPGCGNSTAPTACTLPAFRRLVAARLAIGN